MGLDLVPLAEDMLLEAARHGRLVALVDPSIAEDAIGRNPVVEQAAAIGPGRAAQLYGSRDQHRYDAIGPWLWMCDEPLVKWIASTLGHLPWGFFAARRDDGLAFGRIRSHFKRFLIARTTQGERILFRLHDPRVLRAYLTSADATELWDLLGPFAWVATITNTLPGEVFAFAGAVPGGRKASASRGALRLREEHEAAFVDVRLNAIVERLVAEAVLEYPDVVDAVGRGAVERCAWEAIDIAKRHGLESTRVVATLFGLAALNQFEADVNEPRAGFLEILAGPEKEWAKCDALVAAAEEQCLANHRASVEEAWLV